MSVKVFLPSLLVLALSACAVGPDYTTQTPEAANITAAAVNNTGNKSIHIFQNILGVSRARFTGFIS